MKVQMLATHQNLGCKELDSIIGKSCPLNLPRLELNAVDEGHNKVEPILIFELVLHSHQEGVLGQLQDGRLVPEQFQTADVIFAQANLLDSFLLPPNLDQHHFPVASLSEDDYLVFQVIFKLQIFPHIVLVCYSDCTIFQVFLAHFGVFPLFARPVLTIVKICLKYQLVKFLSHLFYLIAVTV